MRVALFVTCLADTLFPQAAVATVRLLERLGHEVVLPEGQTCCGQMHVNTGYPDDALRLVRRHVRVFDPYDVVVAPSGSCVGSVRHQHAMVARRAGDERLAGRAEEVAGRTYELSEFLVDVLGLTDVGAYYPHRVTYHPTCHSLRMLRGRGPAAAAAARGAGAGAGGAAAGGAVLRLRRHVRGEERGHLERNARRQDAQRAGHPGGRVHRRGRLLPDAHRRRAVPAARRRADRAPGRDPGQHRGWSGGRGGRGTDHRRYEITRSFLGIPATAPPGVGHLRGAEPFPAAARRALSDAQLRRNLGHATTTIRAKSAAVVGEVPDWPQLRAAGRAIKTDTMARLPELLEQLEAAVTRAGGTVHWAADAVEANRIVTDLVQAASADRVMKVKSMATQEIGLNEALEAAGIEPVETDLAELIVQLGDDRPSHILVPAIHRNRAEILEIFLRAMPGVDPALTDEPAALAAAARRHLQETFLSTRVASW